MARSISLSDRRKSALDAVADPWIGRFSDRVLGRRSLLWQLPLAGLLLAAVGAVFFVASKGYETGTAADAGA